MEDAWNVVQIARSKERFKSDDILENVFDEFVELHGDRCLGDDKAIKGGIARIKDMNITLIMQAKGKDTKENIERNFGMCLPSGYRKVVRLIREAEKFNRPVVCFVDTPGAFCGVEAEKTGQGEAIAKCLYEFSSLKVPVISVVLSEGGSGGALALAVADRVWMFENSFYSILSPEGFSTILFKNSNLVKDAANIMKLTAKDLYDLEVIEKIIYEHDYKKNKNVTLEKIFEGLKNDLYNELKLLKKENVKQLLVNRYNRYKKFGIYNENCENENG